MEPNSIAPVPRPAGRRYLYGSAIAIAWLAAISLYVPYAIVLWWLFAIGLVIIPVTALCARLSMADIAESAGVLRWSPLLLLLPAAELIDIPLRPFFVLLVCGAYVSLATCTTRRTRVIRIFVCAAIVAIAVVPYLYRLAAPWVMQGGDDEIVSSLGGLLFMGRILAQGEWPFWNPFYLIGTPFAADPTWGAYHPFNVLAASHIAVAAVGVDAPDFRALTLDIYNIYRILIGVSAVSGAYLLARSYSVCRPLALGAAATFALATDIQIYNWTSLALLPWLVLSLRRYVAAPGLTFAAAGGVLAGTIVLGGQLKMVAYIFILAAFWFAGEVIARRDELRATTRRRFLLYAPVGVALAAAIGAALLVPLLEFAPLALRWTNDPATGGVKIVPARAPLSWAQVVMFDLRPDRLVTSGMRWIALPILAGFGVFLALCASGLRAARPLVGAAVGAVVLAAISLGQYAGLNAFLFDHVAVWRAFRVHAQALYPLLLVIGVGGAIGLHMVASQIQGRLRRLAAALTAFALLVGYVALSGWMGVRAPFTAALQWGLVALLPLALLRPRLFEDDRAWWTRLAAAVTLAVAVAQGGANAMQIYPAQDDFNPTEVADANIAVRWAQSQSKFDLGSTRTSSLWHESALGGPIFKHGGAYHFGMESSEGYMALALATSLQNYGSWSPEDRGIRFLITHKGAALPPPVLERSEHAYTTDRFEVRRVKQARDRIWLARRSDGDLVPAKGTVNSLRTSAHRIKAQIVSEDGNAIVVSNAAAPWWRVTVDGKRVKPEVVQGIMVVPIPAGAATIDIAFDWPAAQWTLALAALAFAVFSIGLLATALPLRRTAAPHLAVKG